MCIKSLPYLHKTAYWDRHVFLYALVLKLSTKFIQAVPLEGSVTALTCLIIMLNLHQIAENRCHKDTGTKIHK